MAENVSPNQDLLIEVMGGEGRFAPGEFQILPYGAVPVKGGSPLTAGDAEQAAIIAAFRGQGHDLVIDYEHQTEGGKYQAPDGKAPAAGWIKDLVAKGKDGLFAVVDWTAKARELLANREYRYFSPVVGLTADRRVVQVMRAALTNAPQLNHLRPLVAKDQIQGGNEMDLLKKLATLLGLKDGASDDDVVAAVKKFKDDEDAEPDAGKPLKAVFKALDLPEEVGEAELLAAIMALKMRPDQNLVAEVAALKASALKRETDELIEAALKEGKLAPAQRAGAEQFAAANLPAFKTWLAAAPVVVPLKDLGVKPPAAGADAPWEAEAVAIFKQLGVDPKDIPRS